MSKVLLAKTALDGHWRGLNTVARALRDGGFEVVLAGMARHDEIAAVAVDEDVDLIGLNVGGRIEVVERIIDTLDEQAADVPVFAGGTVPPWAARRLQARHVEVFPPGSSLGDIVEAARRLVARREERPAREVPTPATRGADRATQLLDVAARLFHERGAGDVGMRAIAEAAGVTTGSLYHHFASKNEILYRICLSMTQEFVDSHLPVLEQPGSPAERLRSLVRAHIVFFWDRHHWLSVAFRELRSLDPDQHAEVTSHRRRYQHAIRHVIADGVDRGELVAVDSGMSAVALLDMVNGINDWFDPAGDLSIEELADHYAGLAVDRLLGATDRT